MAATFLQLVLTGCTCCILMLLMMALLLVAMNVYSAFTPDSRARNLHQLYSDPSASQGQPSVIQSTYAFQENHLRVDPILGKLYQHKVIGRHLKDELSAMTSPIQKTRTVLNHLDAQPSDLIHTYIVVLEDSTKTEGLFSHGEIAKKLRQEISAKTSTAPSASYDNSQDSLLSQAFSDKHCTSEKHNISSTIATVDVSYTTNENRNNNIKECATELDSATTPPLPFPAAHCSTPNSDYSVQRHSLQGQSNHIRESWTANVRRSDSTSNEANWIMKLAQPPEQQPWGCSYTSTLETDGCRGAAEVCAESLKSPRPAVGASSEYEQVPHPVNYTVHSISLDSRQESLVQLQSKGTYKRAFLAQITCPDLPQPTLQLADHEQLESKFNLEDVDKETGTCTESINTSHELEVLSVRSDALLMHRIEHVGILSKGCHQKKFKIMWDRYIMDWKKAEIYVAEVINDETRVLDYRISMTMAGRDCSAASVSVIEDMLKNSQSVECRNPEILQSRLYVHLVDCHINANDLGSASDCVSKAMQLAERISPDVSSAWSWCMHAWMTFDSYRESIADLPPEMEEEIERALHKAVEYANDCRELCWLSESVKLGKAHWHFDMATIYRRVWSDYDGAKRHIHKGRSTLETVNTSLLNTFGLGYYHTLWADCLALRGLRAAARREAGKAVEFYLEIRRHQHALVLAREIVQSPTLETYVLERMNSN